MSPLDRFKDEKQSLCLRYAKSDDRQGLTQTLATLAVLACLWWAAAWVSRISYALSAAAGVLITLCITRLFVLMHDCGHGCLFQSQSLNRRFGFVLGVIVGLPQYVWSKRHAFHHATNGNWDRFRGVLATLSVDEYAALSKAQQCRYRWLRNAAFAPYGGFMYMVFRPRFAWFKGTLDLALHCLKGKHAADFQTQYWRTPVDYRHMCWNNIVSLVLWVCMSWAVGAVFFFAMYFASLALVGAILLLLVNSQHNFEHAYAADSAHWDADAATLHGTSFAVLPAWLNWATANVAYHHVHHLSAAIPSYSLADCHNAYEHLFTDVIRLRPSQIAGTLKCALWDARAQRIISIAEYEQQARAERGVSRMREAALG